MQISIQCLSTTKKNSGNKFFTSLRRWGQKENGSDQKCEQQRSFYIFMLLGRFEVNIKKVFFRLLFAERAIEKREINWSDKQAANIILVKMENMLRLQTQFTWL